MFDVRVTDGNQIALAGRFDASQADRARAAFAAVTGSCVVDCRDLEYISSAGIGVILYTYKRLHESNHTLKLVNAGKYVRDVFRFAGLDKLIEVQ